MGPSFAGRIIRIRLSLPASLRYPPTLCDAAWRITPADVGRSRSSSCSGRCQPSPRGSRPSTPIHGPIWGKFMGRPEMKRRLSRISAVYLPGMAEGADSEPSVPGLRRARAPGRARRDPRPFGPQRARRREQFSRAPASDLCGLVSLQRPDLLQRHRRILGLRKARVPQPRRRPGGALGSDRGGDRAVRPAPLLHASRKLRDLSLRVRPGVLRIRDQPVDRPALDLIRRPCFPFKFPFLARAHYAPARQWGICRFRRRRQPLIIALLAVPIIIQVYLTCRHRLPAQPGARRAVQCRVSFGADRRLEFLRARRRCGDRIVRISVGGGAGDRRGSSGRGSGHALGRADRVA